MNNAVALSLARAYARGKASDLALMALSIALAVFVSASAAGAALVFAKDMQARQADPSYLEISAGPSAFSRDRSEAVEALNVAALRGFSLPDDLAAEALAVSPSLRYAYSYERSVFTVGESSRSAFQGPGGPAMVTATLSAGAAGSANAAASAAGNSATGGAGATALAGAEPAAALAGQAAPPEGRAGAGGQPPGFPGFTAAAEASPEELAAAAAFEQPLVAAMSGVRVDPNFFLAYGMKAAEGSLFTEADVAERQATLVLGSTLAARLYADGKAYGKQIRLDGISYEIIGVLAPASNSGGVDWNDLAFAPFRDIRIGADGAAVRFRAMNMSFAASSPYKVDAAIMELEAYFTQALGSGIVTVNSRKAELDETRASQATLLAVAFALSALCVLVAVLNLTNASAARVLKRRRSLGILRAIGATREDVSAAAFWESALSAGIGLAIGGALALAFKDATTGLLAPLAAANGGAYAAMLPAALFGALLPLLLGTMPAWNALRSAPAELVRPE
jgi:putative ABC transport system permease protein